MIKIKVDCLIVLQSFLHGLQHIRHGFSQINIFTGVLFDIEQASISTVIGGMDHIVCRGFVWKLRSSVDAILKFASDNLIVPTDQGVAL